MEPLYKGQVGDSGAFLQGTSWGQWSLSTRDKLGTVEPFYKGQVGDSGAFLQGTSWGLPWREVVLFSEVLGSGDSNLSFVQRLSSFQRIHYWRFHCI